MLISFDRIKEIAKQITEQFNPNRIYLFGSYAYGQPAEDSDIDLLVVMPSPDPTKPAFQMASKIRYILLVISLLMYWFVIRRILQRESKDLMAFCPP